MYPYYYHKFFLKIFLHNCIVFFLQFLVQSLCMKDLFTLENSLQFWVEKPSVIIKKYITQSNNNIIIKIRILMLIII